MTTTGTDRVDGLRSRTIIWSAGELHENPMGTMHGGVVATLVDTAMGCAVSSTLPADAGRVVHVGGRVATTEARVYDDAGTLYAHAKSTCLVQRGARQ